jgi:hypothetical protein
MRFAPKVLVSITSAPGLQILAVHVHDQVRLRLIERLEAAIDEDALRVQHGAHGAVADEHTII